MAVSIASIPVSPARRTSIRRAITLTESVMCTLIVGIMVAAVAGTLSASAKSRQIQERSIRGPQLAQWLLSEILQQSYMDPDEPPVFGIEPSESISSRSTYDDADDYNEYLESPPRDRGGVALPNTTNWSWSVDIAYVDPTNPEITVGTGTGLKRITVTVTDPQGKTSIRSALRSMFGTHEETPNGQRTFVSRTDMELQIDDNPANRVLSAVNHLNQAPE